MTPTLTTIPDIDDRPVNTTEELKAVLEGITFVNTVIDFNWEFHFLPTEVAPFDKTANSRVGWLVWVSFERPDTITGKTGRGRGRDEIIWRGTTISGVVKTCWLLVELMVRHELMEGYRYNNARIFNPHNSVFDLARIQEIHEERLRRKDA